jgi:hypothetical protein
VRSDFYLIGNKKGVSGIKVEIKFPFRCANRIYFRKEIFVLLRREYACTRFIGVAMMLVIYIPRSAATASLGISITNIDTLEHFWIEQYYPQSVRDEELEKHPTERKSSFIRSLSDGLASNEFRTSNSS